MTNTQSVRTIIHTIQVGLTLLNDRLNYKNSHLYNLKSYIFGNKVPTVIYCQCYKDDFIINPYCNELSYICSICHCELNTFYKKINDVVNVIHVTDSDFYDMGHEFVDIIDNPCDSSLRRSIVF